MTIFDSLSDDDLASIVGQLAPAWTMLTKKTVRPLLAFSVASRRCMAAVRGHAVITKALAAIENEYEIDDMLYELEHRRPAYLPAYDGPAALRRPHRTAWPASSLEEPGSAQRFHDGVLEDRFFRSSEKSLPAEQRSALWVARPLPLAGLRCGPCGTTHDSHAALEEHCKSWRHSNLCSPFLPFPEALQDPRIVDPAGYAAAPSIERLGRMWRYVDSVEAAFRALIPDNYVWSEEARANLQSHSELAMNNLIMIAQDELGDLQEEDFDEYQMEIEDCTDLGNIAEAMIEFCLSDLRQCGMTGYPCELLELGFERFTPCGGSASSIGFLRFVSEIFEFKL